jgi:hypothetical protein
MGLAFGGKDLVFEEDPNLDLRKVHYRLIKDRGLSMVSSCRRNSCRHKSCRQESCRRFPAYTSPADMDTVSQHGSWCRCCA